MRFRRIIASIIDLALLLFTFSAVIGIFPLTNETRNNYNKIDKDFYELNLPGQAVHRPPRRPSSAFSGESRLFCHKIQPFSRYFFENPGIDNIICIMNWDIVPFYRTHNRDRASLSQPNFFLNGLFHC